MTHDMLLKKKETRPDNTEDAQSVHLEEMLP
jgi:hypothetical protein